MNEKYSSIGAHLGLSNLSHNSGASYKDDIESVFYILVDLISKGKFLGDVPSK